MPDILDIEQKHFLMEANLLEDEKAFQRLGDFVPQLMWMAYADGKVYWRNRHFYDYLGAAPEEIETWDWSVNIDPDVLPEAREKWRESMRTGLPYQLVISMKDRDGVVRPFLVRATPARDAQGSVLRWFGTCTEITEQREAELRAQETEERFRTLADASPFMIWVVDPDANLKYHNRVLLDFTGQTETEALREGWAPLIHPDDIQEVQDKFLTAIRNRTQYEQEFRLRRHDGEYIWVLAAGAPHFNAQNELIGFVGSSVEIHKRKLAEQALQESEVRFRTMADSAPLFIWLSGPDGFTHYVNNTWAEFLGMSREEAIEHGMRDAMLPEDFEKHRAEYRSAFSKQEPFTIESQMRRYDGEMRWILNKGAPLFLPDGELAGYIGTSMDITERRITEDQLHESLEREKLIRGVVEVTGQSFDIDVILSTVAQELGHYLKSDRASVTRYSMVENELIVNLSAQYAREGLAPVDPADVELITNAVRHLTPEAMVEGAEHIMNVPDQEQYIAAIRDRMENLPFEMPGLDTDKMIEIIRRYNVRSSLRVNIFYRGTPYGSVSVSQCENRAWTPDEVELVKTIADHAGSAIYQAELYREAQETAAREMQARKELEGYAQKLEQSNRELEQFATIASHDLQEPLRKIQVFSEMLGDNVPDESKEYLGRMRSAASRMQTLVEDLLTLSRVNRKVKPFATVNLNKIAKMVLDDLQISAKESDAEITVKQLGTVYGDDSQLRQLMQNLVGNALKYQRKGVKPQIKIYGELVENGTAYKTTVEDNGIGIRPEHLERVFEPFQRLHNVSEYPGTGIGLTICQKIIQRHDGTLTVESAPNEGSRFSFTVPVK